MVKVKVAKSVNSRKTGKKVEFIYYAPEAKSVCLSGTFNGWSRTNTRLKKDRKGNWKISLKLFPGRYEYRYRVDESWENDQRPMECVPNSFGSWNCVVEVS